MKEARWNILEKLSRVTKFSRDAAVSFLSNPASKPLMPLFPPSVQEMCNNETIKQTIDDYDSARIFLAKWAAGLAAQSENSAPRERKYRNVGVWGHDGWEEDTALGVFEILNVNIAVYGVHLIFNTSLISLKMISQSLLIQEQSLFLKQNGHRILIVMVN